MFLAELRETDLARATTIGALVTPSPSPLPSAIVTYSTDATVTDTLPGGKNYSDVHDNKLYKWAELASK